MLPHKGPHFSSSVRGSSAALRVLFLLSLLLASLGHRDFARAQRPPGARRAAARVRQRAVARRMKNRVRHLGRGVSLQPFQAFDAGRGEVEGSRELQDARLEWFVMQRTYPRPSFSLPPLARSFAVRSLSARGAFLEERAIAPAARPQWEPLGTAPIESFGLLMRPTTGRITAIAPSPTDPNLIIAGAATGGIWRSTDGGINFTPVSDDQSELAVGSIAFSKSDPSIVYAAMGDATGGYLGTGVLKSSDSGLSWTKISGASLPPATIAEILVDPSNSDHLYLAEYKSLDPRVGGSLQAGGFHFSTDGGVTWSAATIRGAVRDIALHPGDPQTIYLALTDSPTPGSPPAGVFKSRDGGRTWRRILIPTDAQTPKHKFSFRLAVTPAKPDTVYLHVTHRLPDGTRTAELFRSDNAGDDWVSLGQPGVIDTGVDFLAVSPADEKTLYLGSGDLFKSVDGGVKWKDLMLNWSVQNCQSPTFSVAVASSHTDQRAFSFSPFDAQTIYIGNDGGLWRSDTGGEMSVATGGVKPFTSLNGTLPVGQFTSITAHPRDPNTIYVGTQDNGALILKPGASTWAEFTTGDSGGTVIDKNDPRIAYVNIYFGIIDRYVDAVAVEPKSVSNNITFGEGTQQPRIGFFPPFTSDPNTGKLYFGTWRLFFSADAGASWHETTPGVDLTKGESSAFGNDVLSAIGISPTRSGVIYTGSAQGRVMTTPDDGKTWTDITAGLPNRFVKSIVVAPSDPMTAYLSVSGFGTDGHVFKTTDAGARWINISGDLPNVPVNALLIDPLDPNILYAGTDVGVFRSTVNGGTWQPFDTGLPPVIVSDFSVRADGTILIATYGRGAYVLVK